MKIYDHFIEQAKIKPISQDIFNEMLTYYVKNNNYQKTYEILTTIAWDQNSNIVHSVLFDAILYKKPGIKIFNLLLQNIEYKVFPEIEVTLKQIKEYHLKEVIQSCFRLGKNHFIDSILLNSDSAELASCAIKISLQEKNSDYAIAILQKYPYPTTKNDFIEYAIKYKCDKAVYFFDSQYNILETFSTYFSEKYPDEPKKHYYKSTTRLVELTKFDFDEKISSQLNSHNLYEFIYQLIKNKDYPNIEKWMDKSRDFIQLERYKNYETDDFSARQLVYFKKFHDVINKTWTFILQPSIEKKFITGLKHGKIDYVLTLKEKFQLPSVLFSYGVSHFYFKNYDFIKLPEQELSHLDLEQRVRICIENSDKVNVFEIIKDYSWQDVENKLNEIKPRSNDLKSTFLNHHMNFNLTNKEIKRKIKI